jgi:hypothetical protein
MVRPGLKRLQESQRVKIQPNKTGISRMLGQFSNSITKNRVVVFNQLGNTINKQPANSKDFTNTFTVEEKDYDNTCGCISKTVYAKDSQGNIIPYK